MKKMTPVANRDMLENALGAEIDPLSEPPMTEHNEHRLWPFIRKALCEVYDPEIPVSIYELGLMYKITMTDEADITDVHVVMTLTSPHCPVAQDMPGMVQGAIMPIEGIGQVTVEIVFEPVWDKSFMAETAKLQLNMF